MKKKNNKKLIFWIIAVAVSTVLSFAFDQLVIRTEDEIRNKNIDIITTKNQIVKYKVISQYFLELDYQSSKLGSSHLRYGNLFIKSLILLDEEKYNENDFSKSFENIYYTKNFLKKRIVEGVAQLNYDRSKLYTSLIDTLNNELKFAKSENDKEIQELINNKIKDLSMPFLSTREKLTKIMNNNKFLSNKNVQNKILDSFYIKPISKYNDLTFENLLHFHYLKNALLKQLYFDTKNLSEISSFYDKKVFIYGIRLIADYEGLKIKNYYKNIYILISILFQILSLLTLLFLFKLMLTNRHLIK